MSVKLVTEDGHEWCHTTVRIPKLLHDMAKKCRISMSQELRIALENRMKERDAWGQNATNTETPATLSSTDQQVDI